MTPVRVYLAGPEVFLSNSQKIGEHKKALCKKHGFEGVFPLDAEVDIKSKRPSEVGLCISEVNENLIKTCEVVIANITPFRDPSAEVELLNWVLRMLWARKCLHTPTLLFRLLSAQSKPSKMRSNVAGMEN